MSEQLTVKEIQFVQNIPLTYTDLVKEATVLLRTAQLYRLKVAKMAIKACTIRHGGKSTGYYTLTDFAKDIGCSRKDLSEWVLVYKRVAVHLEKKIKSDADFNAARRVSDRIAKEVSIIKKLQDGSKVYIEPPKEKKIREMFVEELNRNKSRGKDTHSDVYKARALVLQAEGLLKNVSISEKHDRTFLLDINERSQEIIELALNIQDNTIRLMK